MSSNIDTLLEAANILEQSLEKPTTTRRVTRKSAQAASAADEPDSKSSRSGRKRVARISLEKIPTTSKRTKHVVRKDRKSSSPVERQAASSKSRKDYIISTTSGEISDDDDDADLAGPAAKQAKGTSSQSVVQAWEDVTSPYAKSEQHLQTIESDALMDTSATSDTSKDDVTQKSPQYDIRDELKLREVHKLMEQRRRRHLKLLVEKLAQEMPDYIGDQTRRSMLLTLRMAISTIEHLEQQSRDMEYTIVELKNRRRLLRLNIGILKGQFSETSIDSLLETVTTTTVDDSPVISADTPVHHSKRSAKSSGVREKLKRHLSEPRSATNTGNESVGESLVSPSGTDGSGEPSKKISVQGRQQSLSSAAKKFIFKNMSGQAASAQPPASTPATQGSLILLPQGGTQSGVQQLLTALLQQQASAAVASGSPIKPSQKPVVTQTTHDIGLSRLLSSASSGLSLGGVLSGLQMPALQLSPPRQQTVILPQALARSAMNVDLKLLGQGDPTTRILVQLPDHGTNLVNLNSLLVTSASALGGSTNSTVITSAVTSLATFTANSVTASAAKPNDVAASDVSVAKLIDNTSKKLEDVLKSQNSDEKPSGLPPPARGVAPTLCSTFDSKKPFALSGSNRKEAVVIDAKPRLATGVQSQQPTISSLLSGVAGESSASALLLRRLLSGSYSDTKGATVGLGELDAADKEVINITKFAESGDSLAGKTFSARAVRAELPDVETQQISLSQILSGIAGGSSSTIQAPNVSQQPVIAIPRHVLQIGPTQLPTVVQPQALKSVAESGLGQLVILQQRSGSAAADLGNDSALSSKQVYLLPSSTLSQSQQQQQQPQQQQQQQQQQQVIVLPFNQQQGGTATQIQAGSTIEPAAVADTSASLPQQQQRVLLLPSNLLQQPQSSNADLSSSGNQQVLIVSQASKEGLSVLSQATSTPSKELPKASKTVLEEHLTSNGSKVIKEVTQSTPKVPIPRITPAKRPAKQGVPTTPTLQRILPKVAPPVTTAESFDNTQAVEKSSSEKPNDGENSTDQN